ncbi:MAG: aldehyde dehydrogenase family protein [Chloroflexi bacterium]|nr:aldehyde dehydrogenase family protein [Chloroflexota bacterium]
MADVIDVINPATEEILGQVPRGTAADAHAAVAAAKAAFPAWSRTPATVRAGLLHEAANKIQAHTDELTHLLTVEEGKPWVENEEEIFWVHDTFHYYAELGRHERGRFLPPGDPDQINFVVKEPYGVVVCIVPWNFPLLLLAWKLAPALAAGNTVVIKPSEYTPLSTLRLIELGFDHFPAGVVNVVTGYGPEVGEPLVNHPDVPLIAFTGSLATGQRIAALAAPRMKKLHLELGGKDPLVVAPDVDLATAVSATAYAGLINAGQVCTSAERIYVHESIFGRFSEELADFVGKLRLGNGLDRQTDVGPMLRDSFRTKVEQVVAEAVRAGGKVLVGGGRPAHLERGFFLEPTVMVNVNHEMRLMREETFGPVLPLMPYRDFDEAIALANDTEFGLGATLLTHDARLVKRFYEGVKAGTIWINDPLTDNFAGPFGGMKMTGDGRELGQEGLDEFYEVKHVHWDVEGQLKEYWFPYGAGE